LHRFRDSNTYLPKVKTSRDLDHAHLGTVWRYKTNTSQATHPVFLPKTCTLCPSWYSQRFYGSVSVVRSGILQVK